jgi:hypothetical protein
LPVYDTVFVSTQWDDTQIGQFMLEGIPKVVWHLDFLLKNPDIKIHYGLANAGLPSFLMSHYLFATLGLDQRLINGSVYAKNVIMPREGGCQDVGYNAWEVLHMRDKLLRLAFTGDEYKEIVARAKRHQQQGRPRSLNILLVQRTASRFTQNQGDRARRRWTVAVMAEVVENFRNNFPGFNISVYSDRDVDIMVHPEKAVRLFGRADIVVGMHGAGLTNAMFMQPGSILVETVVTLYDSRFLPYTGNFPRLSSLVGFHHFHYYQETQRTRRFWIDAPKLAADVATYVNQVFRFKDN